MVILTVLGWKGRKNFTGCLLIVMCSYLISFYSTTHPVPGVVSGVKLQQSGCVFSQHSHIFSGLGQLVPAYIELPELSQHSQPFEGHEVVVAGIQKLKVGLRFR